MSEQVSKRARRSFVWNRFLHRSGDSVKGYRFMRFFKASEQPSVALVNMVADMYHDEEEVVEHYDKIKEYAASLGQGPRISLYQQTDYKKYCPQDYHGFTMIGRAHTGAASLQFPSKILNTFYRESHMELDIVNCFPTMLYEAFKDEDIPEIKRLVERRQDVIREVRGDTGLNQKQVKTALLATISAYPSSGFGIKFESAIDELTVDRLNHHDVIKNLRLDLGKIAMAIKRDYPGFYELNERRFNDVHKKRDKDPDKKTSFPGLAIQTFAEDMEFVVTRKIIDRLYGNADCPDLVWKYDGILIDRIKIEGDRTEWLEELSAWLAEEMGFAVNLEIKDLSENAFPVCLPPRERDTPYSLFKREFEKHYFHCLKPPRFFRVEDNGEIQDLSETDFNHQTIYGAYGDREEFVKQWKKDPNKRSYRGIEHNPPPYPTTPGFYNKYLGLSVEQLPPLTEPINLDMYDKHVQLIMGGPEDPGSARNAEYFHDLMAFKIQNPGTICRVMPLFYSVQGTGKDMLLEFYTLLFGHANTQQFGTLKEMSTESAMLDGKLIAYVSETCYMDVKAYSEDLKNLVTKNFVNCKKKYLNTYTVRNTALIFMFSNSSTAFKISADDRRLFPVCCSGRYANEKSYFDPLWEFLSDPLTVRGVYERYMARDVSGFNPSGDRPITRAFKEIAENSSSLLESSIMEAIEYWSSEAVDDRYGGDIVWHDEEKTILRVSSNCFISFFMEKAKEANVKDCDSRRKMEQWFGTMVTNLNGRGSKYKSHPDTKMSEIILKNFKHRNRRCKLLDVRGIKSYVEQCITVIDDDVFNEEEGENFAYAAGFNPGQQSTIQRRP